jgi:hypothetical protein
MFGNECDLSIFDECNSIGNSYTNLSGCFGKAE